MIEIISSGEVLDLPDSFSMEIEMLNPMFNDRGTQSIPATVPSTPRNVRLLGFPGRIDSLADPNDTAEKTTVTDGVYMQRGKMNVTEASSENGITFNIGLDNSTVYAECAVKQLADLSGLPVLKFEDDSGLTPVEHCLSRLSHLYRFADAASDDLAVFPVAVEHDNSYWVMLNVPVEGENDPIEAMKQPRVVSRKIDGTLTDVTVPEGYGVTPFLRVWRVLELIFADMKLKITSNPFKADPELQRLVVLNNTVDAVCRGEIRYSELMPDCTVEEFFNALWARFGFVFNVDSATGEVNMALVKDILWEDTQLELLPYSVVRESITFNTPQYIKLSASNSLDGAAPACERFEDFVRNLNADKFLLGDSVEDWTPSGSGSWSGDIRDDWWDYDVDDPDYPGPDIPDPEEPDPDYPDPDPDDRDPSDYYASRARISTQIFDKSLAFEFGTCNWYRLDSNNGKTNKTSTSFFNWDPQPSGLEAYELTSPDECVPVCKVSTKGQKTGNPFSGLCPAYIAGSRHYCSYIKGSSDDDDSASTPLAFVQAFTVNNATIGRIVPEIENGRPVKLDDGSTPQLSLLFQFKDGLFATYWAQYDEYLRHGNRTVEFEARMPRTELSRINLLRPVSFKSVKCLVDKATYTLPGRKDIPVRFELRTISPQGSYDIEAEQGIPDFAIGKRCLVWTLGNDSFDTKLTARESMEKAVSKFIADTGYKSHGTDGDWWTVNINSVEPVSIIRVGLNWNYKDLPEPEVSGQKLSVDCDARAYYDIYEIHDLRTQEDYENGAPDDWERSEQPLARIELPLTYTVLVYARWKNG